MPAAEIVATEEERRRQHRHQTEGRGRTGASPSHVCHMNVELHLREEKLAREGESSHQHEIMCSVDINDDIDMDAEQVASSSPQSLVERVEVHLEEQVVDPYPILIENLPKSRESSVPAAKRETPTSFFFKAFSGSFGDEDEAREPHIVCVGSRDELCERTALIGSTLPRDQALLKDDSSDSCSVGSEFYDSSDFKLTNWLKAMDAPTFGLAVVALATALTHPVLFVAGALTAFGTVHACSASYGYFKRGKDGDGDQRRHPLEARAWARWFCLHHSSAMAAIDDTNQEVAEASLGNYTSSTEKKQKENRGCLDEVTQASTSEEVHEDNSNGQPEATGTAESCQVEPQALLSGAEPELPSDWVESHYPRLENFVVSNEDFVGLSAVHFFQVFLADDAPYNFIEFQKKRGDADIEYGLWNNESPEGPLSLYPAAAGCSFPADLVGKYYSLQVRTLSFKAKTNSYFGPAYASTTKIQRILIVSKRLAILESKTIVADIPFCERFHVLERWVLRAHKVLDRYTSTLSASCQVFFSQSCPFESQIRTKSNDAVHDVTIAWCHMAQEALKLAEKAKLNRERRSHTSSEELKESARKARRDQGQEVMATTDLVGNRKKADNRSKKRVVFGIETRQKQRGDDDNNEGVDALTSSVKVSRTESEPLQLRKRKNSFYFVRRSISQLIRRKSSLDDNQRNNFQTSRYKKDSVVELV